MAGSFGAMKKGKKGNITKLPKQPQRGLGVAQLEKIRLQSQIAEYIDSSGQSTPFHGNSHKGIYVEVLPFPLSSAMPQASSFVHSPNMMMAYKGNQRSDDRHGDYAHWPCTSSSSNHNNITPHRCARESVTLPLFEQKVQDSEKNVRRQQHEWIHVIDLTTPNDEELDLELRL
ncbi:mediator of RNA polymerase II transcription subunit [Rhynchospora pubera]|uniref:Mediator of RNA polymerase II transcription subunit n=1 Tax=Rhynchospora pubera TaxID=906938 RepID=A0AAV8DXY8_9POAL|nr:mediator of RNA polymerase II transcription subunit [Rhynchospora pubera]